MSRDDHLTGRAGFGVIMYRVSVTIVRLADDARMNAFGQPDTARKRDADSGLYREPTMRTYVRELDPDAVRSKIERAFQIYCWKYKIDPDTLVPELHSVRPESASERYSREAEGRS